ncbi:hypothetical protein K491DRAFT_672937 [Lophiostoma macrostomum CBS 122681]|uniref:Uncharacterized protein n=1 Tax=Lophiostoma macrostomum CBS 122681 TaxID=1314788 RepID=A0A6A6TSX2_9PLEO|nr:hypothetical protein K491DRAFT_672937 [Lophiostoma macrostomum CBS 122681]
MTKAADELNLGLLYGANFRDNFNALTRNIVSGKLLDKAHHCKDKDHAACGAAKRSCWTKLHVAFCQVDILDTNGNVMRDADGRRIVCGEKFHVLSPAGCYQHPYASYPENLDFKALRNSWTHHEYTIFGRIEELEKLEKGQGKKDCRRNGQANEMKDEGHSGKPSPKAPNKCKGKFNTSAGVSKCVKDLRGTKRFRATGGGGSSVCVVVREAEENDGAPKGKKGKKKQQPHMTFAEMRRKNP